jgi:hypothetical protein
MITDHTEDPEPRHKHLRCSPVFVRTWLDHVMPACVELFNEFPKHFNGPSLRMKQMLVGVALTLTYTDEHGNEIKATFAFPPGARADEILVSQMREFARSLLD